MPVNSRRLLYVSEIIPKEKNTISPSYAFIDESELYHFLVDFSQINSEFTQMNLDFTNLKLDFLTINPFFLLFLWVEKELLLIFGCSGCFNLISYFQVEKKGFRILFEIANLGWGDGFPEKIWGTAGLGDSLVSYDFLFQLNYYFCMLCCA